MSDTLFGGRKIFESTLIAAFVCFSMVSQGQGLSSDNQAVKEISEDILQLILYNLDKDPGDSEWAELWRLDSLFNYSRNELQNGSKVESLIAERNALRSDFGLDLKTQYYSNSDPLIEQNGEFNSGDLQTNRVRLGLEWDVLNGGWLENKNKARQLEAQVKAETIKDKLNQHQEDQYVRYNLIISRFNKAKLGLLRSRASQLEKELDLLYQVYYLKGILYEKIIDTRSRLEGIRVKIENYDTYNALIDTVLQVADASESIDVHLLPIVDVDLEQILSNREPAILLDSLNRLEQSVQALKSDRTNDVKLKLQAFQNYNLERDAGIDAGRSYSSFGVSLSLPAHLLFKNPDIPLAKARNHLNQQVNQYSLMNRKTTLTNLYYEYQYKLEQYVKFMHNEILYRERIRMEAISQKEYLDIYRSLRMLEYLDVLRNIQLEMLDLKQQMYLLLLKLYSNTILESISPYLKHIEIKDYYQRLPAKRILLSDAHSLNGFEVRFLKNYLAANDFEAVIVEGGLLDASIKTALHEDGIAVINYRSEPEEEVSYGKMKSIIDLDKLNVSSDSMLSIIHDLNEQSFDIHAVNKEAQPKLGIILPSDFPFLTKASHFSMVAMRLKPNQKRAFIEKIRQLGLVATESLTVILDAEDYKDRIELEALIDELNRESRIHNVIIKGINRFIELDTKSLVGSE